MQVFRKGVGYGLHDNVFSVKYTRFFNANVGESSRYLDYDAVHLQAFTDGLSKKMIPSSLLRTLHGRNTSVFLVFLKPNYISDSMGVVSANTVCSTLWFILQSQKMVEAHAKDFPE